MPDESKGLFHEIIKSTGSAKAPAYVAAKGCEQRREALSSLEDMSDTMSAAQGRVALSEP